jgi:hypothetical protein
VTNRLPEPTTVHWHGIVLPNGMDGVSGLNQRPIPPGETWVYEFTLRHPGTFMYHSHFDEMTQIALGAVGMIVVHPKAARGPRVDRDFVLMAHEWKIEAGAKPPRPQRDERLQRAHLQRQGVPGHRAAAGRARASGCASAWATSVRWTTTRSTSTACGSRDGDGRGLCPGRAQRPRRRCWSRSGHAGDRVRPEEPGDWAMHCHMTHHVMMQMAHGLPNMVGMDPRTLDARMSRVDARVHDHGHHRGMGGMGEMRMEIPRQQRCPCAAARGRSRTSTWAGCSPC